MGAHLRLSGPGYGWQHDHRFFRLPALRNPGLGGEIENQWFQRNFVGKQITDTEGNFVSIKIAKGAVEDAVRQDLKPNYVDGISGATMTGKFLTQGLEDILQTYEPVSVHFRNQGMLKLPENALVCQPPS